MLSRTLGECKPLAAGSEAMRGGDGGAGGGGGGSGAAGRRHCRALQPPPRRAAGVNRGPHGRAVQVTPMKPMLKPLGTEPLRLECDGLLSSVAFKFNLRRYRMAALGLVNAVESDPSVSTSATAGVCSSPPSRPPVYVELGAGRGYLSHFLVDAFGPADLLLVERKAYRFKAERSMKQEKAAAAAVGAVGAAGGAAAGAGAAKTKARAIAEAKAALGSVKEVVDTAMAGEAAGAAGAAGGGGRRKRLRGLAAGEAAQTRVIAEALGSVERIAEAAIASGLGPEEFEAVARAAVARGRTGRAAEAEASGAEAAEAEAGAAEAAAGAVVAAAGAAAVAAGAVSAEGEVTAGSAAAEAAGSSVAAELAAAAREAAATAGTDEAAAAAATAASPGAVGTVGRLRVDIKDLDMSGVTAVAGRDLRMLPDCLIFVCTVDTSCTLIHGWPGHSLRSPTVRSHCACTHSLPSYLALSLVPSLFARSVPVHLYTLAAPSSLAFISSPFTTLILQYILSRLVPDSTSSISQKCSS